MADKKADLAGPDIGNYDDLSRKLPEDYAPLLSPKETMRAFFAVKNYIEENLCKELNLQMVQIPLIVDRDSGVNDYLDRDGSRTPVEFPCGWTCFICFCPCIPLFVWDLDTSPVKSSY